MKGLTRRVLLAVAMAMVGVANADEELGGAGLAWKFHCTTCHGRAGVASSDHYPNLAGQNPAYLESRLRYFREGLEPGNRMNGHAAPLTDEEIRSLANYFNQPTMER
ncbi:MAG: cytochrome c [Gammaproteobacteria bacterium]|nr:cytochrome c [Gammaproteobacteria bacterium]